MPRQVGHENILRLTNTLGCSWTELHVIDGRLYRLTEGALRMEHVPEADIPILYTQHPELAPWLRANGIDPQQPNQQEELF